MRGQGLRRAQLCSAMPLSGANPALPFLPKPPQPVRWEVPPQVTALWSRTRKQGAGQGVEGVWVGVGVCVCARAASLKNLLLVCNSSHITSAETGVHQRQPRDDKSPERLQRGF